MTEAAIDLRRRIGARWRKFRDGLAPGLMRRSLDAFLVVIGTVAIATLLTAGADYFVGDTTIYTFYMFAIVAIGFRYETPFLLLASVLSALAYAYYFADPPESFAIERPEVSYALVMLTAVAIATGRAAQYLKKTHSNLRTTRDELMDQTRELTTALRRELEARSALRNLVATMCHEFRTPLTTIDVIAQTERRNAAARGDEKRTQTLDSLRGEIRRMNELLVSLQEGALHRRTAESLQPSVAVRLDELVGDICDLQRLSAQERDIVIAGNWPNRPITGNPQLLRQLFTNLLTNAMKYSPADEPIVVEASHTGICVDIAVADHGIGIPRDELPRVFEAFYRATNTGAVEGTGLGLALCREIVEAHRGQIWIAENAPRGTRVTVRLPLDPAAVVAGT